ncbi:hypothetical protein HUX53_09820 [Actinomadura sp. BRA 177]|nr:hypothetical protein [Actinomadura sp. BRA 177]
MQTKEYACAVIECGFFQGFSPDVDGLAEIRMRRQLVLDSEDPPHLWAVVSEAALRQQFGGREVMRRQLERLVQRSRLPNVTLQILPFTAGGHAGLNGSFTTLTTTDLSVVLVENLTTGWYLEASEEIRRHDIVFDHLRAAALSASDSRSFIERLVSES